MNLGGRSAQHERAVTLMMLLPNQERGGGVLKMAVTNKVSGPTRWNRLLGFGVALAFLVTACGSSSASGPTASAPGITASTITIGSTQPLTGPAAPGYSEISKASNAYFQWVNDHGGELGRKITYNYEDDGYNPTNTTTTTRHQVLPDKDYAEFDP